MIRLKIKKYIATCLFVVTASVAYTQMTTPSDPGNNPEHGDPPLGGGAPVDGGIGILLTLGAAYGAKKLYPFIKRNSEDLEEKETFSQGET